MKYRQLDANGDYTFGGGQAAFFINSPETVAQAVVTRLKLNLGEWFLDTSDGTPWETKVLGKYTGSVRDPVVKSRVLGTLGVVSISNYSSQVNPQRAYSVNMQLTTVYGAVVVAGPL
jgi:hypothetical protein